MSNIRRRRTTRQPEKKSNFRSKLINQCVFCVLLVIAVTCVNAVNKTQTNIFVKNIKHSLYTSIDYKKTSESIAEKVKKLFNERKNKRNDTYKKLEETTQPAQTDKSGEVSGDTSFNCDFILCGNSF